LFYNKELLTNYAKYLIEYLENRKMWHIINNNPENVGNKQQKEKL
jgi:hypothetical protein